MQRAVESPPTQLTVNQAAGIAVSATAAAAVQPAKASHARYLLTCSMTTAGGLHDRTGGARWGCPQADCPSLRPLVLRLMPRGSGSLGFNHCKQDSAVRTNLEAKHAVVERKQELAAPVLA
jgi:hypothetical protein